METGLEHKPRPTRQRGERAPARINPEQPRAALEAMSRRRRRPEVAKPPRVEPPAALGQPRPFRSGTASTRPGWLAGIARRSGRFRLCSGGAPVAQRLGHPFSTQIGGSATLTSTPGSSRGCRTRSGTGLDPLISHYANFPSGVNLMWNTSLLLPSFMMSPITVIFGAAFSYNILMTAAPALSTTFAYMAFRRWTTPLPSARGCAHFRFFSLHDRSIVRPRRTDAHLERPTDADRAGPSPCGASDNILARRPSSRSTGVGSAAHRGGGPRYGGGHGRHRVVVLCALNWSCVVGPREVCRKGLVTAAGSFLVLSAPFLGVSTSDLTGSKTPTLTTST